MTLIPFTQYLLPDGRKKSVWIEVFDEYGQKALDLIENEGCHFDVEVLTTGKVSFTCERGDDLISIQVCDNDPQVIEGVNRLVEDAYDKLLNKGEQ